MSTTPVVTYRKTKSGEWVAFGPRSVVIAGRTVVVTKKSGETKVEHIDRVGSPFTVAGVQMVYGYLAAATASSPGDAAVRAARSRSSYSGGCPTDGDCWSFASVAHCHECGK